MFIKYSLVYWNLNFYLDQYKQLKNEKQIIIVMCHIKQNTYFLLSNLYTSNNWFPLGFPIWIPHEIGRKNWLNHIILLMKWRANKIEDKTFDMASKKTSWNYRSVEVFIVVIEFSWMKNFVRINHFSKLS